MEAVRKLVPAKGHSAMVAAAKELELPLLNCVLLQARLKPRLPPATERHKLVPQAFAMDFGTSVGNSLLVAHLSRTYSS